MAFVLHFFDNARLGSSAMGIQGLPNFVRNHSTLSTRVKWTSDSASSDHFVVDGNAFAYHYASKYRTDWTHGGKGLYIPAFKGSQL